MADDGPRGDLEFGTTPRLVTIAAERHGDRPAIIDGDVTLSYAALRGAVRRAARGLRARGIDAGDRVALWAPNIWEWIVAALAVHEVGGVLVPINTRFKGPEAAYVLERSGARLLFVVGELLGTDYVAELRRAMAAPPPIVVLRGAPAAGTMAWAELLDLDGGATATVQPDDVCDLLFTSGTTGKPKAVPSTHAQSLRAYCDWAHIVGLRQDDRYLVVVPFFHTFGYKAGWLAAFTAGATVYPQAVFDAGAVLARILADRITVLPGPPTLYQTLLALPGRPATSLRLAVTGAAVIPIELVARMRGELGFETVLTGYGLTEATGIATLCRESDDDETIARTSGRAIPGVEVRIAGDGEILVRGYNVMRGYLDDAEGTAATIDGEGWLHTGDIGALDERGSLRITDRKKDMYIVGGFNVYPAEVENVLLGHPGIAQAAVVGAPDERLGEVGVAYLVARPGADLDSAALIAWCRERMANYKVPRRVEVLPALPTNATGKVLKFQLRERAP